MSVIFILIGVSFTIAIIFLIAFIWAVQSDQYADKFTPSIRILFEDEFIPENNSDKKINDNHLKNKNKKAGAV